MRPVFVYCSAFNRFVCLKVPSIFFSLIFQFTLISLHRPPVSTSHLLISFSRLITSILALVLSGLLFALVSFLASTIALFSNFFLSISNYSRLVLLLLNFTYSRAPCLLHCLHFFARSLLKFVQSCASFELNFL